MIRSLIYLMADIGNLFAYSVFKSLESIQLLDKKPPVTASCLLQLLDLRLTRYQVSQLIEFTAYKAQV